MKNNYLTIQEAADFLRVKPATIRGWMKLKRLKSYQPSKKILFKESDLETFIERSKV